MKWPGHTVCEIIIVEYIKNMNPDNVHKTSLSILEEIGIPVDSERCLKIYDSIGCKIDHQKKKVWFREDIINNALSAAKGSHRVYNREGSSCKIFGDGNLLFTSGACAIKKRISNGNYKETSLKDLENFTILHDHLGSIDIIHTAVDANDVDQNRLRTAMAGVVFKNTDKPCWFLASHPRVAEKIFRMGITIRGSEDDLRKKPFFRIACAPNSVLGFSKDEIETLLRCSELGIPTDCEHYPIMGLTAPLSVTAALAINNANFLCALVLKKHIDPDNPSIFPILAGSTNMKSGEIITSSPEIWEYYIAGIEMADYYGLPSSVLVSSESKDLDMQLSFEKAIGTFISANAGANNIFDATGAMDSMNMASLEDALIENEFISAIKKFLDVKVNKGKENDLELIKRGLKNKMYFLDDVHTINNFKEFLWDSGLLIKENFDRWFNFKDRTIEEKARKQVKKIIDTHVPTKLSNKVIKDIDKIVEEA